MAQLRRIFLVDRLAMFRAGVRRIIEAEPDLCVVGMAEDTEPMVLEKLQAQPCDLLLLDLGDPPARGLDLMEAARLRCPGLCLLAMSESAEPALVRAALGAGALGFVAKTSEPEHLIDALRTLLSGRHYVDPRVAYEALAQRMPVATSGRLTAREAEVAEGLVKGMANVDIARQLALSEKTVSAHKANLMHKLQVQSLADLIRLIDRHPYLLPQHSETA